jgi:hypothetical protein
MSDGKPLKYKDFPNYGLDEANASDFSSKSKQNEIGVATDVVDARILKINAIINTKCIL